MGHGTVIASKDSGRFICLVVPLIRQIILSINNLLRYFPFSKGEKSGIDRPFLGFTILPMAITIKANSVRIIPR